MLFDFQISMYLLFSTYSHASTNWRLKIDYSERKDKQQSNVRILNITSVITPQYESGGNLQNNIETFNVNNEKVNKINQLNNKDKTFEDEGIPINHTDTIYNDHVQQNVKDKRRIINNLDNYEIVRKKTNYPTPRFNYPFKINTFEPNVYSKTDIRDDLTNHVENSLRRKTYAEKPNMIFDENSEIFKEFNKQNKLIERIAITLLRDEINARKQLDESDFQNILDSVEAKKNRTTVATTTTTTTTEKLPTLLTVIDETEVRNALKNDPFVNRILKLAHKKRLEYLERMGYG